jgi:hypothetical protein
LSLDLVFFELLDLVSLSLDFLLDGRKGHGFEGLELRSGVRSFVNDLLCLQQDLDFALKVKYFFLKFNVFLHKTVDDIDSF